MLHNNQNGLVHKHYIQKFPTTASCFTLFLKKYLKISHHLQVIHTVRNPVMD